MDAAELSDDTKGYLAWALKGYRRDKRKYGEQVAGWNLYINALCLVDERAREQYGGLTTRYRWVGKKAS